MSIIAALTDGQYIYISYDSFLRRINDDLTITQTDDFRKLTIINSRSAIGITGTWDWDREDFITQFAHDNANQTEFDVLFENLLRGIRNWQHRRVDEDLAISLMGFNSRTPALLAIGVAGMGAPDIRTHFTLNLFSGDPNVANHIGNLLRDHVIMDVAGELHVATQQAVIASPDTVSLPVQTIILRP